MTDRLSGKATTVRYEVDRVEGDRVIFNGGARVEGRGGEVLESNSAFGGEADSAMPPGGWFKPGLAVGARWKLDYTTPPLPRRMRMQLEAAVTGEQAMRVGTETVQALRIEFTGHADRNLVMRGLSTGRYRATAWYAPSLGRLVRFEVNSRGGISGGQFIVEETLELVAVH